MCLLQVALWLFCVLETWIRFRAVAIYPFNCFGTVFPLAFLTRSRLAPPPPKLLLLHLCIPCVLGKGRERGSEREKICCRLCFIRLLLSEMLFRLVIHGPADEIPLSLMSIWILPAPALTRIL